MKRAMQFTIGAVLVCLVVVVVIDQTGFGQGGPNEQCPALRTDRFGFPLDPPYSEYPTGGTEDGNTELVDVFKPNLPCCAVGTTIVPADCILEICIPPARQVFPGEVCPRVCMDQLLTIDDGGGAVRNCLVPFTDPPPAHGGGSNFFLLTGANAN